MFRQIEESQTLLINTQTKALIAQNKDIIKFGFGQSPFLPPKPVLKALKKRVEHKEYTSVQGDYELRKLISKFHKDHSELHVSPENILLAPGSKILLFTILMAIEVADVFIVAPSWVSYAPQAKLAGHHTIKLTTTFEEKWRITPKLLKEAAQQKKHEATVIIINYPGNPDGLTYSEKELKDLAATARELDIIVISDEIYGLLDHQFNHKSFASYYPEKTITTTGLSKWCGAGGWRFGAAFLYETIEPEFKQALIGIGSETYSCAPAPVQMAAKVAYANYAETLPYLQKQLNILKPLGNYCAEKLNQYNIRTHAPEGAFYLFPDFSLHKEKLHANNITTSNALCERLLNETGVALLPASAFGFATNYLAARIAYVDFDEFEEDTFKLETHCPRIIEGIDKICQWTNNL